MPNISFKLLRICENIATFAMNFKANHNKDYSVVKTFREGAIHSALTSSEREDLSSLSFFTYNDIIFR